MKGPEEERTTDEGTIGGEEEKSRGRKVEVKRRRNDERTSGGEGERKERRDDERV